MRPPPAGGIWVDREADSPGAVAFNRAEYTYGAKPTAPRIIRFDLAPEYPPGWGVHVELSESANIETFAAAVRAFALAVGYHPENVDQYFPEG